jgi:glycosyltransferase involved in cell wall biosynthesis
MALLPLNIRFLVVGTGPLEAKLKALAEKLSISRRVQFLGHVPNEEIPHYLHVSDIFIRPSLSEGFGISFIEAMAAGLPVITTPVGGIVDFLYDPDETPGKPSTGLFVKPEDHVSIREQVVRLINDNELRQMLIQNGKDLVRTRYDWDLIARDMKEKIFDPTLRRG